ncbi:hypothetical protein N9M75_02785 [Schleiferiaceae bacterium]|nr:hypothetical protein [Schleiferiaceae bacterium]
MKIFKLVVCHGAKNDFIVAEIGVLNEFNAILFMDLLGISKRVMNV